MADLPENILAASKEAVMQLLPKKSYARYINAYDKFVKWQQLQNTESFYQEVMLAYFLELSKTLKPSTLWSIYSMIKSTISCNHNVNFGNYDRLAAFLSSQKSGFTSKKSNVFTAEEIKTFLMEAPDNEYLAVKVVLIFGICGACRGDEIVSLTFNNVKDDGEQIESLEHKRQIAQKLVDAMALQPIDQNVCDGGSTAIEKKEHVVITQTLTTQTISSHLIQKSQYI
ncbi:hypothetical protein Bhyg_04238 [Pseudolycoriella hygida]|uniref:Uncharacterized protein n=1 Tax=Pseudolycoriella hygida TaxID=35572 RepID=A0A9Q0NGB1_9DIPT|nr:hypothetical protein Bhyg_04238 [Pseudolycoriella hygida]